MDEDTLRMNGETIKNNTVTINKRSFVATIVVVALVCSFFGAGLATKMVSSSNNNTTGSNSIFSKSSSTATTTSTTAPIPATNNITQSPAVMIAQKVGPAVVGISNQSSTSSLYGGYGGFGNGFGNGNNNQEVEQGSGSGVIIDKSGYIVTNNHVVEGADKLTVSLSDGRKFDAKLIGTDPQTDLAVLKINASNLTVAALGDSTKVKAGEMVVAIGNPMGEEFAGSITQGVISALNRSITIGEREATVLQTDAAINPGNSGGALVNAQGLVIGINSAKITASGVEGMGFAIPISDAKPIIDQLINQGHITRPWLGIQGVASDTSNGENVDGVLIAGVVSDSPADHAGIQEGDIIKSINGQSTKDMNDLKNYLLKLKPKDKVALKITRNKKDKDVNVILGEMPSTNN